MVYINHIYANVTASDDSQANVYAVVLRANDIIIDPELIQYIVENTSNIGDNTGVYRLTDNGDENGNGIPFGQVPTVVERNLFKRYYHLGNSSVDRLKKGEDYSVRLLAIDEYGNQSVLSDAVTGNIVDRPAPVHKDLVDGNVTVNVDRDTSLSNITTSLEMSGDMYFEYYAAMFSKNKPTSSNVVSFFDTNPTDAHVVYGNVTSGYETLLLRTQLNETPVFNRVYSNIANPKEYDLAADQTSDRYLCVYMKNTDPYDEHILANVQITTIEKSVQPLNYSLDLTASTVFDRSANVAFTLTNIDNTTVYYKTFDTEQTVNGEFIDDLFENPQGYFDTHDVTSIRRIRQYWNNGNVHDMVFGHTYYVYARARNYNTGEMSPDTLSNISFTTGADPLLQSIIKQTRNFASNVDFANTIVVDQSNVDIYIGVTSENYDNDNGNIIKHLTNNNNLDDETDNYNNDANVKDGVLQLKAQVPTNGLVRLPNGSVIDKYYTDIVNNTTSLITGAGGQYVYMYVVDENQRDNVFSATLASVDDYVQNQIDANITMQEIFDRSFRVQTPNADPNAEHYIMAFANTDLPATSFWTETNTYNLFVAKANVSTDGTANVDIGTYFDANIENAGTAIAAGGSYHIYTVALDTINQETYHDSSLSILADQIAAQPPVISNFTVEFNT